MSVLIAPLALGLGVTWLELRHRLRPASPLRLSPSDWGVGGSGETVRVTGWLEISNPHRRMEVFVPELRVEPVLLGRADLSRLKVSTRIEAQHPDEESRADGYWPAYIVKGRASTRARVSITISGPAAESIVDSLWVDVHWLNYGPFGRLPRRQGVLVPLHQPDPLTPAAASPIPGDRCQVLPLRTHLLGPLDDPIAVLRRYAEAVLQPGDVLTLGETPLAVMQGRYRHPSEVEPGFVARLACRVFHPTSSLATACGMQTLIDLVGPTRVLCAWIGGLLMKLVGIPGFYRLAGDPGAVDRRHHRHDASLRPDESCSVRSVRNPSVMRPQPPLGSPSPSSMSTISGGSRCWRPVPVAMRRCSSERSSPIPPAMPTSALPSCSCVQLKDEL